jgi:uncharacterized protein (TIGR01777 family)
MKILISGATGFIGLQLIKELKKEGHEIFGLTRNIENAQKKDAQVIWIEWTNFHEGVDLKPYGKMDAVINLVGENLANKRWNNEQKKVIYNSRIDATETLFKMLKKSQENVDVFISTSAIGIYGNRMSEEIHEASLVVDDYIGKLCQDWEAVVDKYKDMVNRSVIIRVGLVLGKGGGMMEKMLPVFQWGLGGKLASGSQYMSWIHLADICRIFQKALTDKEMSGVYNGTAPFPVTNKDFTHYLGKILNKPTFFTVPRFALKIVMGEMAEHVLSGSRIVPRKLKEANFHFLYPTLEVALKDVVSKERK